MKKTGCLVLLLVATSAWADLTTDTLDLGGIGAGSKFTINQEILIPAGQQWVQFSHQEQRGDDTITTSCSLRLTQSSNQLRKINAGHEFEIQASSNGWPAQLMQQQQYYQYGGYGSYGGFYNSLNPYAGYYPNAYMSQQDYYQAIQQYYHPQYFQQSQPLGGTYFFMVNDASINMLSCSRAVAPQLQRFAGMEFYTSSGGGNEAMTVGDFNRLMGGQLSVRVAEPVELGAAVNTNELESTQGVGYQPANFSFATQF